MCFKLSATILAMSNVSGFKHGHVHRLISLTRPPLALLGTVESRLSAPTPLSLSTHIPDRAHSVARVVWTAQDVLSRDFRGKSEFRVF